MTDAPGPDPQGKTDDRETRLAEALRANLRRRKAAVRDAEDRPTDRASDVGGAPRRG